MTSVAATSSKVIKNYDTPPLQEGLINQKLDYDVLQMIFLLLSPKDLQKVTSVCNRWRHMAIRTASHANRKIRTRLVEGLLNELDAIKHAEMIAAINDVATNFFAFQPATLKEIPSRNLFFRTEIREVLSTLPCVDLSSIVQSFNGRSVMRFVAGAFKFAALSRMLKDLNDPNYRDKDKSKFSIVDGFLNINELQKAMEIADSMAEGTYKTRAYFSIVSWIDPDLCFETIKKFTESLPRESVKDDFISVVAQELLNRNLISRAKELTDVMCSSCAKVQLSFMITIHEYNHLTPIAQWNHY